MMGYTPNEVLDVCPALRALGCISRRVMGVPALALGAA